MTIEFIHSNVNESNQTCDHLGFLETNITRNPKSKEYIQSTIR